jgi:uncharacterized membrane protein
MEEMLGSFATMVAALIEAAAVTIILFGCGEAFVVLLRLFVSPSAPHGVRKAVWRRLGTWLVLGLEFQLAADIVTSVVSPTWQDIGRLGAIAVIRTFLNYFLEKDLADAPESEKKAA